ncbi:hypothetical protein HZB02_06875 [Candidatus Woesearchaeota archaeon]|nr:hypothetical protein [Candidatus Woesearchaeota archaeon]
MKWIVTFLMLVLASVSVSAAPQPWLHPQNMQESGNQWYGTLTLKTHGQSFDRVQTKLFVDNLDAYASTDYVDLSGKDTDELSFTGFANAASDEDILFARVVVTEHGQRIRGKVVPIIRN